MKYGREKSDSGRRLIAVEGDTLVESLPGITSPSPRLALVAEKRQNETSMMASDASWPCVITGRDR